MYGVQQRHLYIILSILPLLTCTTIIIQQMLNQHKILKISEVPRGFTVFMSLLVYITI